MQQQQCIDILDALEKSKFYGSLEIKYEAGRITLFRKTETFKPATIDCATTPRSNRGHS